MCNYTYGYTCCLGPPLVLITIYQVWSLARPLIMVTLGDLLRTRPCCCWRCRICFGSTRTSVTTLTPPPPLLPRVIIPHLQPLQNKHRGEGHLEKPTLNKDTGTNQPCVAASATQHHSNSFFSSGFVNRLLRATSAHCAY